MTSTLPTPAEEKAPQVDWRPTHQELWQRYRGVSDPSTEERLVEQYIPLVKTIVGRLAMTLPAHVSIEDLHSAGLIGLLQAIRSFDPHCGASFETFARFRIRGAVLDELRRMDWVPRSVHDKARKLQEVMSEVEQRIGRVPKEEEMAAALKITLGEYREWLESIRPATFVHLDGAQYQDATDPATLHECVADDGQATPFEETSKREFITLVMDRLNQLPDMQRKVLSLYYVEDMRLKEIAAIFGLTESRISQIHSQAILALKAYLQRYEAQHTPARD